MQRLFQSTDISILVLFRIAFGVLGFADIIGTILHKETRDNLANADFNFKYYGFEWMPTLPEWGLLLFMVVMIILALFIALGHYYRWCTVLFAIGFTHFNFTEVTQYLNHGYLFCWLSVVMCFLPAHRCFSLDAKRNPSIYSDTTARWHIWLFAFLMGVVYFYGGLAKVNTDWLHAQPLKVWLQAKRNIPLIGGLISQDWVAWVMSYGGLALDLLAVPLLLMKRTRPVIFVFILLFHFINTLIFQIGIFPLLSIVLTLFFFPPDLPRRVFYYFLKKYPIIERMTGVSNTSDTFFFDNYKMPTPAIRRMTTGILIAVCLFHLLIPFRHHLISKHVAWTEEGHRYSWRMMLRGKTSSGYFMIKNNTTGKEIKEYGTKHLTSRQRRKMRSNPELVLQYAHYLRDTYNEKGQDVEIYAHIRAGLNGRRKQDYIDSTVDLAKEEYPFFGHAKWIIPIKWERE